METAIDVTQFSRKRLEIAARALLMLATNSENRQWIRDAAMGIANDLRKEEEAATRRKKARQAKRA